MPGREDTPRERVEVKSVPSDGRCVAVRFLGPCVGVFTHRLKDSASKKDNSIPCRGTRCESKVHNLKSIWKGFCPAQLFNSNDQRWYLCAFELTESAWELLGDRDYRGEVWILRRPWIASGSKEVDGFLDSRVDEELLGLAFDVKIVTNRMWRMPDVVYGVRPSLGLRLTAVPEEGAPPLCLLPEEQAMTDPVPPLNAKTAKQLFEEFKANGYQKK